jgi:hypothetical protein
MRIFITGGTGVLGRAFRPLAEADGASGARPGTGAVVWCCAWDFSTAQVPATTSRTRPWGPRCTSGTPAARCSPRLMSRAASITSAATASGSATAAFPKPPAGIRCVNADPASCPDAKYRRPQCPPEPTPAAERQHRVRVPPAAGRLRPVERGHQPGRRLALGRRQGHRLPGRGRRPAHRVRAHRDAQPGRAPADAAARQPGPFGLIFDYVVCRHRAVRGVLLPDYADGLLGPIMVAGAGLGLLFMPLSVTALSRVRADVAGVASSLLNTGQQIGGSIGLAVLGAVAWTSVATASAAAEATGTRWPPASPAGSR